MGCLLEGQLHFPSPPQTQFPLPRLSPAAVLTMEEVAKKLQQRRAAIKAEDAKLEAQLRALGIGAPAPAAARDPRLRRVGELLGTPVVVNSPSKPGVESLQKQPQALASLDLSCAPLSRELAQLDTTRSLVAWAGAQGDDLLHENSAMDKALLHLPLWIKVHSPGSGFTAKTLFGKHRVPGLVLPWGCNPELPTLPCDAFHPAFNGAFKSAMSGGDIKGGLRMMDELLTYCMLGMVGS